jgi:hypothetical protein
MKHIFFSFDHSNVFIWSLLSFKYFYQRPVDRPTILSRVLGASLVSGFSLCVHGTRSLRSGWSAGAPWSDLYALTCEQALRLALGP